MGTGAGARVSRGGEMLGIPALVAPLGNGIPGSGEGGWGSGIKPELEAINLGGIKGPGIKQWFFRNHGQGDRLAGRDTGEVGCGQGKGMIAHRGAVTTDITGR